MSFSFPVRPQNIVVSPRLNEGVKEGTINLTCSVQQVKPQPKIYWQIGDEGPMHNGSDTDSVTKHPNGTFSIQSSYQWQAKHEDDSKSLYCIITLDGDHKEVLGKEKTHKPYGQAEISPLTLEMAEGSTDSIYCAPPSVQGNPAPSWFVWRLQNGTFLKNTTSPELKLSPANVNESYLYQCIAGNYLGESDASEWANITVLGEF
ncbi:hypothetical protein NP493_268g00000 [Ridgeia piscesae]|uniref:Ig-like domain-containing protein n=1 Tax=Ridgeia piscesae TaxID=27915 RepID=A0AAD9UCL8_RIDPI|nr:hypothetical protein NP493_268g00000 [Ridgeia piscesae]